MALNEDQALIVDLIRGRIGETKLTDEELWAMYEDKKNVNRVAAAVWEQKAGAAGDLIDITEGSSTRRLSQVAAQARNMASFYRDAAAADSGIVGRQSRTRQIVRP